MFALFLVFVGAIFIGGLIGAFVGSALPLNWGSLTIGAYNINISSFVVTAIVTFPILVYLIRRSGTEPVIRG